MTFLWAGCLAEVSVNTDPDGDGLQDADEAALGSDPGNPDSDGDDFTDGEEAAQNTDPMNPDDHPYIGGWKIDACRDDVQPSGNSEGSVANDFSLMDQFGEQVSLHSFCDRVVYMVFAAFWWGACISEAGGLEAEYQERVDRGGMFLEVIIEDEEGGAPDLEGLQAWADTYGLTMPVLADAGESVLYSFASGSIGLPYTVLIDRGVVVESTNYPSMGDMDALLDE